MELKNIEALMKYEYFRKRQINKYWSKYRKAYYLEFNISYHKLASRFQLVQMRTDTDRAWWENCFSQTKNKWNIFYLSRYKV